MADLQHGRGAGVGVGGWLLRLYVRLAPQLEPHATERRPGTHSRRPRVRVGSERRASARAMQTHMAHELAHPCEMQVTWNMPRTCLVPACPCQSCTSACLLYAYCMPSAQGDAHAHAHAQGDAQGDGQTANHDRGPSPN